MRSQRGQVWPYLLLSVALVGALGFGAYQTRQKNEFVRVAENKYMSAFHKLKWTSEQIEERTAKLMATNDPQLQENLLADLRVFSAQAVEHMSALPFTNMNTPRITNFLNTLRMQTDEKHYKLSQGSALDQSDWSALMELRKQAVFFEDELSTLLGLVGNNRIRWVPTVQATSPIQTGNASTPITKSVLTLDQGLPAPPGEENALAPGAGPLPRPKMNLGHRVDTATAMANIRRFIDTPLKGDPVPTGAYDQAEKTGGLSVYYFDATKQNGTPLNFGVSIHGGHILYMIDGRPITEQNIEKSQLIDKARQMLRQWGYGTAEYVSAVENDGTLVMDFAPLENGVSLQTELIKVSLAMDNGELVGFDARNYWINHHARQLEKPKLSAAQAMQHVSPRLKVTGEPHLALVANRRGEEVLVWEVQGQIENQRFRVYIDAANGHEVNVIREAGDPAPPMGGR
ncbi:MAG: PepSY1/2 domain-containing protein [Bacillota bacterium]